MLCRKLNQGVQIILYEKDYDKLIPVIQEFMRINPLYNIVEKAITIVKKITPYFKGKPLLHYINDLCKQLHILTPHYHIITTLMIRT